MFKAETLTEESLLEDGESLISDILAPELYTMKIPLYKLLGNRLRIVLAIIWVALLVGFIAVLFLPLGAFHEIIEEPGKQPSIHIKITTTWSTIQMFKDSGSWILVVLYFNGVYVQPFIHLLNILFLLFGRLRPEKRRFRMVWMRFLAKLTIQPCIMNLINITAFDSWVKNETRNGKEIHMEVYLQPDTGMILQFVLGPCLITFVTFLLYINKLGPPPRTSLVSTRISLFASGIAASLMCVLAFKPLCRFTTGGIFGMLLNLYTHSNTNDLTIPDSITDLQTKHGLDSVEVYFTIVYFYIILVICPLISIIVECLWRLISGPDADDYNIIQLFRPLRILRRIRNIICMFYIWDVLVITVIIAALELGNVSNYLEENLLSESCKSLRKSHPKFSGCYSIDATIEDGTWWLLVHVLAYYISAYLPVLYRSYTVFRNGFRYLNLYPPDQVAESLLPSPVLRGWNPHMPPTRFHHTRQTSLANSLADSDKQYNPLDPGLSPIQAASRSKLIFEGESDTKINESYSRYQFGRGSHQSDKILNTTV